MSNRSISRPGQVMKKKKKKSKIKIKNNPGSLQSPLHTEEKLSPPYIAIDEYFSNAKMQMVFRHSH